MFSASAQRWLVRARPVCNESVGQHPNAIRSQNLGSVSVLQRGPMHRKARLLEVNLWTYRGCCGQEATPQEIGRIQRENRRSELHDSRNPNAEPAQPPSSQANAFSFVYTIVGILTRGQVASRPICSVFRRHRALEAICPDRV